MFLKSVILKRIKEKSSKTFKIFPLNAEHSSCCLFSTEQNSLNHFFVFAAQEYGRLSVAFIKL